MLLSPVARLIGFITVGSLLLIKPASAETVKIAFIEILSGPFALIGVQSLQQLREVVSYVNSKSPASSPKFEIVPFDGKGSTMESAGALKAASDQGIRYVTQGGGSGVAFALVEAINNLAEREPDKAMVFLNYAAMDPELTNIKCSFWHFRFFPSSEMVVEGLTTHLVKRTDIKKVYLLNQNYSHGQRVSRASREYLTRKRPDIQIVGDDLVPLGLTRDFATTVSKIKASGADTVITSNWGSDLTLLVKSAREYGLDINFFTMNANNPGVPAQLGSWGAEKVAVVWNWECNALTPELEDIATNYKKKYGQDFISASHWFTMNMLLAAIREAKSTDPKAEADAFEGMRYKSPVGELEMRKADHQLLTPMYFGVWAKQGTRGVRHDAENTGFGFRPEAIWPPYLSSQPTSCQMKRPAP